MSAPRQITQMCVVLLFIVCWINIEFDLWYGTKSVACNDLVCRVLACAEIRLLTRHQHGQVGVGGECLTITVTNAASMLMHEHVGIQCLPTT